MKRVLLAIALLGLVSLAGLVGYRVWRAHVLVEQANAALLTRRWCEAFASATQAQALAPWEQRATLARAAALEGLLADKVAEAVAAFERARGLQAGGPTANEPGYDAPRTSLLACLGEHISDVEGLGLARGLRRRVAEQLVRRMAERVVGGDVPAAVAYLIGLRADDYELPAEHQSAILGWQVVATVDALRAAPEDAARHQLTRLADLLRLGVPPPADLEAQGLPALVGALQQRQGAGQSSSACALGRELVRLIPSAAAAARPLLAACNACTVGVAISGSPEERARQAALSRQLLPLLAERGVAVAADDDPPAPAGLLLVLSSTVELGAAEHYQRFGELRAVEARLIARLTDAGGRELRRIEASARQRPPESMTVESSYGLSQVERVERAQAVLAQQAQDAAQEELLRALLALPFGELQARCRAAAR